MSEAQAEEIEVGDLVEVMTYSNETSGLSGTGWYGVVVSIDEREFLSHRLMHTESKADTFVPPHECRLLIKRFDLLMQEPADV